MAHVHVVNAEMGISLRKSIAKLEFVRIVVLSVVESCSRAIIRAGRRERLTCALAAADAPINSFVKYVLSTLK